MIEKQSNEQVIQNVVNPQEAQNQKVESDEKVGCVADEAEISWKQAFNALNTFIKFAKTNKRYNSLNCKSALSFAETTPINITRLSLFDIVARKMHSYILRQ